MTLVLAGIGVGATLYTVRLKRERTTALHGLAQQHAQAALALVESGEWHRALLSLVEAIEIGSGHPAQDRMNRVRFECLVRQSPKLAALWFAEDAPLHAHFTANSQALLFLHAKSVRLHDAATGAPLGPALAHDASVIAADANADGSRVVCGTDDGKWTLWDPRAGSVVARGVGRLRGPPPAGVSWTQGVFGGDRFVVANGTRAESFLGENGQPVGEPIVRREPLRWAVLTPDGASVTSATEENVVRVGAEGSGPEMMCPSGVEHMGFRMTPHRIDTLQADGNWFGIVHWPDYVPKHTDRFRETLFAQTFRRGINWVLLARSPRGVSFFDGWSPVMPRLLEHGASGVAGTFDAAGIEALTLASDGSARLWDLAGDRARGPCLRMIGAPLGVALSGDGKSALVRSATATWLWRQCEPRPAGEPGTASGSSRRSADGRTDVRIGVDATVLLCDAATGEVLLPPLRHPAPVEDASFSPNGLLLATRAADAVRVWETATGQPLMPPSFQPGLSEVRWSADSVSLFSRGEGGWRVTDLAPGVRPLADMRGLSRLLSAGRFIPGKDHGLTALTPEELRAAWEQAGAAQPE